MCQVDRMDSSDVHDMNHRVVEHLQKVTPSSVFIIRTVVGNPPPVTR